MINKLIDAKCHNLLGMISTTFSQGQAKTISAINAGLVMTYCKIGQHILSLNKKGK
ncbi:DUF1016 N-terminal domain-containing protein [Photobacterium carnosum]|uniref:hypothetical protein n=1 Tax=Photobacterium carnosum TaxID=2023717 RepID=UPI001E54B4B3|nr:hypothetical protein [Photobacterium carnosum]